MGTGEFKELVKTQNIFSFSQFLFIKSLLNDRGIARNGEYGSEDQ